MSGISKILLPVLLFLAAAVPVSGQELPVLRVGVTNCQEHLYYREIKDNFRKVLEETFRGRARIEISTLTLKENEQRILDKTLDIFLTTSGFYRSFVTYGVTDIATVITREVPNPNRGDGSLIFALAANTALNSLDSIKGKTVAAKDPAGFVGWQAVQGEIAARGQDPDQYFSRVDFTSGDALAVFKSVLERKTDVGVLPACFLERYNKDHPGFEKNFRVINSQTRDKIPCWHSTKLYPNWTVAITSTIPIEWAKQISAALLSEKPDALGIEWARATRFDEVDHLLRMIRTGPYAYLREWSVRRVFDEFWPVIVVLLGMLAALIMYTFTANRLVRARTRQLSHALLSQDQYARKYERARRDLSALQRMSMLSQMSSILAHELRQPLNSIALFSLGLLKQIEKGNYSPDRFSDIVGKIRECSVHSNDIITRVRTFARNESHPERCRLGESVRCAVNSFLLTCSSSEIVTFRELNSNIQVMIDPFEIELVILNLLRNASDALASVASAQITVTTEVNGNNAVLKIEDNGKKLSQKDMERIENPFFSYKKDGMGIGLVVVREIVQRYKGSVSFSDRKHGGLCVTVSLPLAEPEKAA